MSHRSIVVALLGAIGDVLLCTPLLEALRSAFPDAKLTFVVGSAAAPVLENLPLVDEIVVLPDGEQASRWDDLRVLGGLARRRFDLAICLTRADKLALALWLGRTPIRLCYTPLRFAWMFTHRIDAHAGPHTSAHRTGYFLAAAAKLGIAPPPRIRLHYRVTPEERTSSRETLRRAGADPDTDTLVAIHPGTSRVQIDKRRWAASKFAEVARHAARRHGCTIVLLGGPDELAERGFFRRELAGEAIDLIGSLTIRQAAAVLEQCVLLVHNDSSPLHLAGAVGTPALAIFGYQDPKLWGPLGPADRVVRRDLPCSPCLPDFPCDRSFECIRQLEPATVIEELDSMLESAVRVNLGT